MREFEGEKQTTRFLNSDQVSFPILSTGLETDDDKIVVYHKRGGSTLDTNTGTLSHFVRKQGVYWQLMVVNEDVLKEGFGRQG